MEPPVVDPLHCLVCTQVPLSWGRFVLKLTQAHVCMFGAGGGLGPAGLFLSEA